MKVLLTIVSLLALAGCTTVEPPAKPAVTAEPRVPTRLVISPEGGLLADFGKPQAGDVEVKANGPFWGTVTLRVGAALAADGSVSAVRTQVFPYTGAGEDTFVLKGVENVRYVQADATMLSELNPSSICFR